MAKARFPAPHHDHAACIARSLARAETAYRKAGGRLTELRERVLRELAAGHEALGAYDIIQRLAAEGRRVAPISVYRVLESLLEIGLIHRIESRNAFVACHAPHAAREPTLFLVCEACGGVAEGGTAELGEAVLNAARTAKFELDDVVLETTGLCEHCAQTGSSGEGSRGIG